MKTKFPRRWILALVTGLLVGSAARIQSQESPPPSTLTVTVRERAGGGVSIELSGSAPINNSGHLFGTGSDPEQSLPPQTVGNADSLPLPEGLFLNVPLILISEPEGEPQEIPVPGIDLPLTQIYFDDGCWNLGGFEPIYLISGAIQGRGSIVADDLPFTHFVPGTYVVQVANLILAAAPEDGGPEEIAPSVFYEITYRVIPLAKDTPILQLSSPRPFRPTAVGRSGGTRLVRVRNVGTAPALNAEAAIRGTHAEDFSVSAPRAREIPPGGEHTVGVRFRPRDKRIRRATLTVTSNASPVSAPLRGIGLPNRPHSPRFPRGGGS